MPADMESCVCLAWLLPRGVPAQPSGHARCRVLGTPVELSCSKSMAMLTLASVHLPAAPPCRAGTVEPLRQAGLLALAASHGAGRCFWPGTRLVLLLRAHPPRRPLLPSAGVELLALCSVELSTTWAGSCLPGASTLPSAPTTLCLPHRGLGQDPAAPASSRCEAERGIPPGTGVPRSVGAAGTHSRHSWPHPAHLSGRSG